jgi:hypothetical protein
VISVAETPDESPEYDAIVRTLADSVASITGGEQFLETVREELGDVDGAEVIAGELVVDDRADDDDVYEAIAEALDREAQIVPVETILEAHGGTLADIPGGEAFVERYVD